MSKILLSKILNYENRIFNKFIEKRTNLIKRLEHTPLENYNQQQIINFIDSLKSIINLVKNAEDNIDDFFLNYSKNFNDNVNFNNEFIIFYLFFKDIFFSGFPDLENSTSPELSETSDKPESRESCDSSELKSDSDSDSV